MYDSSPILHAEKAIMSRLKKFFFPLMTNLKKFYFISSVEQTYAVYGMGKCIDAMHIMLMAKN